MTLKRFIFVLLLISTSAQARLNTIDFECLEIQDMLKDNGTLILSHGNPALYSKFVATQGKCEPSQKARKAFAISQDRLKCNVGYVCGDRDDLGFYIAPNRIYTCKEGKTSVVTEHDSQNDRSYSVIKVCRSGKWQTL